MNKDLLPVIDSLYATVEVPAAWPSALAKVSGLLDASVGMIATPSSSQRQSPFYVDYNHSPEAAEAYARHYHAQDEMLHRAVGEGLFRVGTAVLGEEVVSRQELHKTAYYNEFMRPMMNAESAMAAVLSDEATDHCLPSLFTSFFRRPGAEPFTQKDVQQLMQIAPHLRRAVMLRHTMLDLVERQAHLATAFDAFSQPIMLLTPDGQLIHANLAGQDQLDDWQCQRHLGRWPREIDKTIHLAGKGQVAAARLTGKSATLIVIAYPLGERMAAVMDCRPSTIMLLIVDTRKPPSELYGAVAKAYGLTPAETRLLPLLAQAMAPAEMAGRMCVDISTIRTQLSSIYGKTGLRRQQDVMVMLGCLPPLKS